MKEEGREVIRLFALHLTKAGNSGLCVKAELTAEALGQESVSKEALWCGSVMPWGTGGTGTSVFLALFEPVLGYKPVPCFCPVLSVPSEPDSRPCGG